MKNFFQNPNGMCEDTPCCGCCGAEDGELPDNFGAEDAGEQLGPCRAVQPAAGQDEPSGEVGAPRAAGSAALRVATM